MRRPCRFPEAPAVPFKTQVILKCKGCGHKGEVDQVRPRPEWISAMLLKRVAPPEPRSGIFSTKGEVDQVGPGRGRGPTSVAAVGPRIQPAQTSTRQALSQTQKKACLSSRRCRLPTLVLEALPRQVLLCPRPCPITARPCPITAFPWPFTLPVITGSAVITVITVITVVTVITVITVLL